MFQQNNLNIQVQRMAEKTLRVQALSSTGYRLDRTWTALGDRDFQWGGYPRSEQPYETQDLKANQEFAGGFHFVWQDGLVLFYQGKEFYRDLSHHAYKKYENSIRHMLFRRDQERYFGYGEKTGELNKYGRRLQMHNTDAMGYRAKDSDPLYKHWPFGITYVEDLKLFYGIYYDNAATCSFDLGCERHNYFGPYRYYEAQDGDLDFYIFLGPDLKSVLDQFLSLTGTNLFLPQYSLVYLGSTMSYTDAEDAQAQMMKFVRNCEEHQIKCPLFHLSSGYTSIGKKRYVFHWNPEKFPEPEKFLREYREKSIRVNANIKPVLLEDHPLYEDCRDFFIQEGDHPLKTFFWDGEGSFLDFSNPNAIAWWQKKIEEKLFAVGIDSVWNDNNEFRGGSDQALCAGFGQPIELSLVRPLQSLWMNHASRELWQKQKTERLFAVTRSGFPGIQSLAQTWSGDNYTSWESIKYSIPMGSGMSLSGLFHFGHDVGGFAGPKPDPELFIRWLQYGVFMPRFCIHSWNEDQSVNEAWMYPECMPIVKKYMDLREQLIPYLYSLSWAASHKNEPIHRPIFWDFAEDPKSFDQDFEYMLGPYLLVAPIYEDSARARKLYFPKGPQRWFHLLSDKSFTPGIVNRIDCSLEDFPVFVRSGTILPQKVLDKLQVHIWCADGKEQTEFDFFADDGLSYEYLKGKYQKIHFVLQTTLDEVKLKVKHEGALKIYEDIEVVLHNQMGRDFQLEARDSF